jgi:hypothetical protein
MKNRRLDVGLLLALGAVIIVRASQGQNVAWPLGVFLVGPVAIGARIVADRYDLPHWSPGEAYVTRLRRWRREQSVHTPSLIVGSCTPTGTAVGMTVDLPRRKATGA